MAGESVTSFTCEGCGAPVEIRAKGLTLTAICSHCGTVADNEDGVFKLIEKVHHKMIQPMIKLGTKGKLRDQTWQAIGYMRRFEPPAEYDAWDEYLLYNPYQGYTWLSHYNGHWSHYQMVKGTPMPSQDGKEYTFQGEKYELFHDGRAKIASIMGEFYWRARAGQTAQTLDAIRPPFVLSRETDGDEVIWSLGEYVSADEIKTAFHPDPVLRPIGVAINQPYRFAGINDAWAAWFLVVMVLFAVQVLGRTFKGSRQLDKVGVVIPETGAQDVPIGTFTLSDWSTSVSINVLSNVSQSWMTAGVRVVPKDPRQVAHEFEKDLSFYSGYDGGEYWSEGSNAAEFLINALPRGEYSVFASGTPEKGHQFGLWTTVTVAPRIWSNFWLAIFLITLPLVWLSLLARARERERWSWSEFNPYQRSSSDGSD